MRRVLHALSMLSLALLLGACPDGGGDNAASQVQQGLEQVQAGEAAQTADTPARDSLMERQCADVSQSAMDAVEAKMERMNEEQVMLTGDEQLALRCSRYQKYLRGEVRSYCGTGRDGVGSACNQRRLGDRWGRVAASAASCHPAKRDGSGTAIWMGCG